MEDAVDRRTIYPNLLKRLGGELALCADALYKVIMGMWCVCLRVLRCGCEDEWSVVEMRSYCVRKKSTFTKYKS